jgi:hypothetical protein
MDVIPGLGRLRQEDCEVQASLSYIVGSCLKNKSQKKKMLVRCWAWGNRTQRSFHSWHSGRCPSNLVPVHLWCRVLLCTPWPLEGHWLNFSWAMTASLWLSRKGTGCLMFDFQVVRCWALGTSRGWGGISRICKHPNYGLDFSQEASILEGQIWGTEDHFHFDPQYVWITFELTRTHYIKIKSGPMVPPTSPSSPTMELETHRPWTWNTGEQRRSGATWPVCLQVLSWLFQSHVSPHDSCIAKLGLFWFS